MTFSDRAHQQKKPLPVRRGFVIQMKLLLISPAFRRGGVSTEPAGRSSPSGGRLLWRHRAQPSATLDKTHSLFGCGVTFCRSWPTLSSSNRRAIKASRSEQLSLPRCRFVGLPAVEPARIGISTHVFRAGESPRGGGG